MPAACRYNGCEWRPIIPWYHPCGPATLLLNGEPDTDRFERFCASPNATSVNHTLGYAGVEPITRFLVAVLRANDSSFGEGRLARWEAPAGREVES